METLRIAGAKNDEAMFTTQVHDAKGGFVPYTVTMKTKDCRKVSVRPTEL